MTLSITPITHTDPALLAGQRQVMDEVSEHDTPGIPLPTERMLYLAHKHPWHSRRSEIYVAWRDGAPAGMLDLGFPLKENLSNMNFGLQVAPAHRRQGVGRALWDKAVERARANDRTKVISNTAWTLPGGLDARDAGAGPAFAAALGFESANLPEVMRRLDISTLDHTRLDELVEKAKTRSDGYRIVQWQGAAPEEYVADLAYLDSRLMQDAPMGDLAMEPEEVDPQRFRQGERLSEVRGRTLYNTAAVHEATGTVVAWTALSRDAEIDWHGWQLITIVEPEHRGHRLGALVKVANLRYFLPREPTVRTIDTFNAAENSYMISINEDMGFRPIYAFQNWQRDI